MIVASKIALESQARSALDALTAELKAFQRLRREAGLFADEAEPGEGAFVDPSAAVESRMVGIVGAEGVGKSTLINSILGEDAVPTDLNRTGTVAPIFVHGRGGGSLQYSVSCTNAPERLVCESKQNFEGYLLQRNNVGNGKMVERGMIETDNPYLTEGLVIVDLPGLMDGMSEQIRRQTERVIRKLNGAVVVVFGREFGPAIELIKLLVLARIPIEAVVINLRSDMIFVVDASKQSTEHEIAAKINEMKKFFISELTKIGKSLSETTVFAIHLPSMHDLRICTESVLNAKPHLQEISRFREWFESSYGYDARIARLRKALEGACRRVTQAEAEIMGDIATIGGIMWGAVTVQNAVAERIGNHRGQLHSIWKKRFVELGGDDLQVRIWSSIQARIRLLKHALVELAEEAHRSVPQSWFVQTAAIARSICQTLNAGVARECADFQAFVLEACKPYWQTCRHAAADLAADEVRLLPLYLGPTECSLAAPDQFWDQPGFNIAFTTLWEMLDSAPIIARLLREIRSAEMYLDESEKGVPYTRLDSYLAQCRDVHLVALQSRLDTMIGIALGKSEHLLAATTAALAAQLDRMQSVRGLNAAAKDALNALRGGAEPSL